MVDQVEPAASAAPVAPVIVETPAAPDVPVVASPPIATDTPAAVSTVWGDDWRAKLAGDDKSYLKTLDRFADPVAYAKHSRELQAKFSSGDYKKAAPGKDATPEEIATWRKESGIPEKVEDYKITPPHGVVFGEADKPMLDSFTAHAHQAGWSNDALNQAVAWYGAQQEAAVAKQAETDDTFKAQATDQLREMWQGQDYYRNLNAAKSLVQQLPQEFQDIFAAGRTADGRVIGDHPIVLAAFAQLSRELNPGATIVPAGTQDVGKAIDTEIGELRNMMRDPASAYHRGPDAKKNQDRFIELVEAKNRIGRNRAA